MSTRQLALFERHNPGVVLNVFGCEMRYVPSDEERLMEEDPVEALRMELMDAEPEHGRSRPVFYVVHHSKQQPLEDQSNVAHLLLYDGHYYPIRDLSRLMNEHGHQHRYLCWRCLEFFRDRASLERHGRLCQQHGAQAVEIPDAAHGRLRFQRYEYCNELPLVIYADFECVQRTRRAGAPGGSGTRRDGRGGRRDGTRWPTQRRIYGS